MHSLMFLITLSCLWWLMKVWWLWWHFDDSGDIVKNLGFSADRLIRRYFPFKGLFRLSPLSMRIHTHHWSIRNCISTIPDTTMTAKVIMSSPSILVDFFKDNSWSRWGSNPGPLAWEADMLTTTPPGLRFLHKISTGGPCVTRIQLTRIPLARIFN